MHACLISVTLPGKVNNVFCLVHLAQDAVTLGTDDWYFLQLREVKRGACLHTAFCDLSDITLTVVTSVTLNFYNNTFTTRGHSRLLLPKTQNDGFIASSTAGHCAVVTEAQ